MFNIRKNKTLSLQYKKRKFPNSNVHMYIENGWSLLTLDVSIKTIVR
jgi:hypothetical protein